MRRIRSALCYTLAATAALVASPPLSGQQYPTKPVKIIVPGPPGGEGDITARFFAQRLTKVLGQSVIVENKPGAGGIIGTEAGLKAPPDGYTLTLIASPYATAPVLHRRNFDPIGDITPIIQLSQAPYLVAVTPSLPVKDLQELVALAKANPGKLNFSSGGPGTPSHLATELLASRTGIRMHHVPYKGGGGGGQVINDTIAGRIDLVVRPFGALLPHVRAGRIRAIAVASRHRSAAAPDIPTVAESGLADYEVAFWVGLAGPKGLPRPIIDRINGDATTVLKLRETGEWLQADGRSSAGGTPGEFLATIKKEIELWREVARQVGVQPE